MFYGINFIDNKINGLDIKNYTDVDKENLIESLYQYFNSENIIPEEDIKYYYDRSFEYLEKKIMGSDLPFLLDFIKTNFNKTRLWYNPNHPTGELMKELVRGAFEMLDLEFHYDDNDYNLFFNAYNDWSLPIPYSVKKHYDMLIDDKCSALGNTVVVDTRSFISEYIKSMHFDFA